MKRIIASMLVLLMAFALVGCGAAGEAGAPKMEVLSGAFSEKDLGIEIDGKTYYLREDSAPLLKALGDGYEYSEVVSCVYDGKDKTFEYKDIIVNTVPVDGKDVIEMITITGDGYITLRGITVGDSLINVKKAYGEAYFDDGYLTYSLTNDPQDIQAERIQFEYSEDTVSTVYIYSPSY